MGKEEPSDRLKENKRADTGPKDRNPKQWSQEEAPPDMNEGSSPEKRENKPADNENEPLEKTEPWITGRKKKD